MVPPLWKHQEALLPRLTEADNFGLLWEMGTGKSREIIEACKARFLRNGMKKTIVFCPPIVIQNWVTEWKKYANLQAIPLTGSGAKRLKTFAANTGPARRIFVTNYESLSMPPLLDAFQTWKPEVLVFDESQKLKDPKSKRSKLAHDLANPWDKVNKCLAKKPNTYILSGSPFLNTPLDIFQQFLIMDGGKAFGRNFFAFRNRYFRDRNAGMPKDRHFFDWQMMTLERDGVDAASEVTRRIFESASRVTKEECMDLPPEVAVTIPVEMSPEQGRLYHEMRKDLITFYDSQACTASLAITKALRLMQITSGFISTEASDPTLQEQIVRTSLPDTPKLEACKALLEQLTEDPKNKVLVWAVWKENYKQLKEVCEKLKLPYVEVHGGITAKARDAAVHSFNNDPRVRVFIGHPGAGGIGINLVVAGYSIFYSRNFSLEQYLQARARNHRGGSKEAGHKSIVHYDLVVQGTIDELALQKLATKEDMSDKLLSDLVTQVKIQTN